MRCCLCRWEDRCQGFADRRSRWLWRLERRLNWWQLRLDQRLRWMLLLNPLGRQFWLRPHHRLVNCRMLHMLTRCGLSHIREDRILDRRGLRLRRPHGRGERLL